MGFSSVTRQKLGKNLTKRTYTRSNGRFTTTYVTKQNLGNGQTMTRYASNSQPKQQMFGKKTKSSSGRSSSSNRNNAGNTEMLVFFVLTAGVAWVFYKLYGWVTELFAKRRASATSVETIIPEEASEAKRGFLGSVYDFFFSPITFK